jgi:hypothetical protein
MVGGLNIPENTFLRIFDRRTYDAIPEYRNLAIRISGMWVQSEQHG